MNRPPKRHPDAYDSVRALQHFKEAAEDGRVEPHPRVMDRLGEIGLRLEDLPDAIMIASREITPGDVAPVKDAFDPPGHAFVWNSNRFRRRMYLKFRLEGKRPNVVLYSLHPADYRWKDRA